MKTKALFITLFAVSISAQVFANTPDTVQATDKDSIIPYQMTLLPPLGTNGIESHKTTNNVSLNVIAGYNGGVEGIEVGGFANVIAEDVNGIQAAGFTNVVRGNVNGIQAAGFTNVNQGETEGVMGAGFSNHTLAGFEGVQLAGFTNTTFLQSEGGQAAGFFNTAKGQFDGVQLAGFGNFAGNRSRVAQLGGFLNTTSGQAKGAQLAGFLNAANEVEGIQASGFLNVAKRVKGLQLGFINVCDSIEEGLPIGFFSHVNNGYRRVLLQGSELAWVEAQYRTGTNRLHNVFSLAYMPIGNTTGWAFGYGLGTEVWASDKADIAIDLLAYHVNEGELWTEAFNNLLRLSGRYTWHPTDRSFGIHAGPSLNLLTSSQLDAYGEAFESNLAPYAILEDQSFSFNHTFWVGGQIGISF